MTRRQPGGGGTPWPLGESARAGGSAAAWRPGPAQVSEVDAPGCSAPANDPDEDARAARLIEARKLLLAARDLLDLHSRSPAAANVDLAIHQIDQELGD